MSHAADHPLPFGTFHFTGDLDVAVCIDAIGEITFWLVDSSPVARRAEVCIRLPDHEMLGPLPEAVQERLAKDAPVCGRASSGGLLCRSLVATWGDACARHGGPRLSDDE